MVLSVRPLLLRCVVAVALIHVTACGGGSGDGSPDPTDSTRMTTFVGQLSQASRLIETSEGSGSGVSSIVQVCVADTSFCTDVDETGAFTLAANVGGDVVLLFDGPSFTARLELVDVPFGATVRIEDIVCSLTSGDCVAADVDIVNPLNLPPDCSDAVASPSVLWPPNHEMVRIGVLGVIDADDDPIVITATDVLQNEDDDEPGSGNTSPDAQLDPLAVRAERSGRGSGRLYTISFVAEDGRGGTCSGVVEVCVPHDQGQGSDCG